MVVDLTCLSICERILSLQDRFQLRAPAHLRGVFCSWQINRLEHLGSPLRCCLATPPCPCETHEEWIAYKMDTAGLGLFLRVYMCVHTNEPRDEARM